jgi:hypothetical protein
MPDMKKLYYLLGLILCFSLLFSSCTDDWKGELYHQMVSLKAPIGTEGVYDIYLRYKTNGKDTFNLPVIISGTQNSKYDLDVKIGVDSDTLAILNKEQYNDRTDLYYHQLPQQYFKFPSNICHISAGTAVQTFPIDFDFTGLDLVNKWVLPLTVEESPSYARNTYNGRDKALLNINLFNDYSGTYSASGMNIYFDGETNNPAVVDTRTAKVVDENSIFIYAGTVWEEDVNRDLYKVIIKFGPGTMQSDSTITGNLTLSPGDPANKFNLETTGDCTYEIQKVMDPKLPYLMHYYVILNLNYKYSDITSDPNNPVRYNATGMYTLERKINTLIPDQDQAIEW